MNETRDVVKPCLEVLSQMGFIVIQSKMTFIEAAELLELDDTYRGVVWRQNVGAVATNYRGKRSFTKFGVSGLADIMGIMRDGRLLAIECKTGKNVRTPLQEAFAEVVNDCGGVYLLIYDAAALWELRDRLGPIIKNNSLDA
jgi:hypothetical protein